MPSLSVFVDELSLTSVLPPPPPQVCLVNDPRPQNPYEKLYSVEFLGNMVGGHNTLYNNQPIQLLKKAAADSIKEGEVLCVSVSRKLDHGYV
jgi:aminopeptidase C